METEPQLPALAIEQALSDWRNHKSKCRTCRNYKWTKARCDEGSIVWKVYTDLCNSTRTRIDVT